MRFIIEEKPRGFHAEKLDRDGLQAQNTGSNEDENLRREVTEREKADAVAKR